MSLLSYFELVLYIINIIFLLFGGMPLPFVENFIVIVVLY